MTARSSSKPFGEALRLLTKRSVRVISRLARFARSYRDLPCLGFTHFQAAQPTSYVYNDFRPVWQNPERDQKWRGFDRLFGR